MLGYKPLKLGKKVRITDEKVILQVAIPVVTPEVLTEHALGGEPKHHGIGRCLLMMEKTSGKSEPRNKMGFTRGAHGHFDMAKGGIICPDDMAVPLSGNMLLKPEQKGLA
jgi:hypothetical protein